MELNRQMVSTETARLYDQLVELINSEKEKQAYDDFNLFLVTHIIAVLEMQKDNARRFDFGDAVEETAKVIKVAKSYRDRIINLTHNE